MKITTGTLLSDRYRLVSLLAVGGMGEIWRAWDQTDERVVAVKVLKENLIGQETFLARLRAEAENTIRLQHPNLAAVYDFGELDGQGWLVMELVDGRPLSEILEGGKTLDPSQLAIILIQVARGLQAAHDQEVIHRDVKPANILVSGKGVAKLTDFGISIAPQRVPLTAVGMVMGTAQYLPPEQAIGEAASPSGDLYALGIIAYESLAGKRPFTGATQVDIALAHVKEAVPPLPASVPEQLAAIVMRLLSKKPQDRPASAAQLAHILEDYLRQTDPQALERLANLETAGEPITAKPSTSRPYRTAPAQAPTPAPQPEAPARPASRHAADSPVDAPGRESVPATRQMRLADPQNPEPANPYEPPPFPKKAVLGVGIGAVLVGLIAVILTLTQHEGPQIGSLDSGSFESFSWYPDSDGGL